MTGELPVNELDPVLTDQGRLTARTQHRAMAQMAAMGA